jgi:RNase H-like domain found in reverse transcriptase/Reverse transcriptase (RNA-dependent DNA polymerase)/Integrase zinc binding domain
VTDFRQLNKHLTRLPFPLPNPQQLFRTMDGFSFCTTMDLNMGFWAITLDEFSQKLCTIVLPWGKYSYLRLPMGLSCSPDIYQEKMSSLFADIENVIIYIDDICIITKGTFQDHITILSEVLKRLQHNNLKVHADKSKFCCFEAEFLGFRLTRSGLSPQQNKIEAIIALKSPSNIRQVRSFLGFINYYKVFVSHRSGLLSPISNLVKKGVKFTWSPACEQAFSTCKDLLGRKITLAYPNFAQTFEIHTDASKTQLGSVIHQNNIPIAFYSRKLTDAQTRYTVTELELLSIVETLQEYRTVLLGHDIIVYTDHKNLTFDTTTTDRVRRWRLIVDEYGPTIQYIKGSKNTIADFLSRYPRDSAPIPTPEINLLDPDDVSAFPLDFRTLSTAQQTDKNLLTVANKNTQYVTKKFQRVPLIHYKDRIVVPSSLQPRIIQWYHDNLCHPGSLRTYKSIQAHFHWKTLSPDVKAFCTKCTVCQQYKKNTQQYGLLPTKIQSVIPWHTVCVDMMGPWTIPTISNKANKTTKTHSIKSILIFTAIDPSTNFIELQVVANKHSNLIARTFDRLWLCRYPRPMKCIHDSGTEFTGFEFQELLSSYGIQSAAITVANPQSNSILERAHQTIGNQLRSLKVHEIELETLDDVQSNLIDPVKWALNSTFHTTLQASPGQLTFNRDMILPTLYLANWELIRQRRQHATDANTIRENHPRIPHKYKVNDQVLIVHTAIASKLSRPTSGPFLVIRVTNQNVNGTITIQRTQHTTEVINIRRLRPYRAVQDANAVTP